MDNIFQTINDIPSDVKWAIAAGVAFLVLIIYLVTRALESFDNIDNSNIENFELNTEYYPILNSDENSNSETTVKEIKLPRGYTQQIKMTPYNC
jgi:hypothetical protein